MSIHTHNHSNPHLNKIHSHLIGVHNLPVIDSAPFVISKPSNQTVTKHQVSQSAHWTNLQKEHYIIFAIYFRQLLTEQNMTEINWNIFKGMSKFVKTRNPQQCRSHHIKLLKQFKGINKFISIVVNRIPKIKEKIMNSQNQLEQIQNQFNLFIGTSSIQGINMLTSTQLYSQRQTTNQQLFGGINPKADKQQFIKTADSYNQQQNPVNFNNFNKNIFSSRSQFKPYQNYKPKNNKGSLPSFGDQPEQEVQVKQQAKPYQFSKHNISLDQIKKLIDQGKITGESNLQSVITEYIKNWNDQNKNLQKMKQVFELHYYFQLWTSKLQKIMRQSS